MQVFRLLTLTIGFGWVAIFDHSPASATWIGKLDGSPPDFEFTSEVSIGDAERCIIRLNNVGGVPHVYGQPDRPAERMIIWTNDNNDISGRADLIGHGAALTVRVWLNYKKNPKGFDNCIRSNLPSSGLPYSRNSSGLRGRD
ncbi:hypothetical protein KX816_01865 [Sphingosinicellaceae bacterium]|nr:hypothetical protein KX816_01865 [Sphingosinicellaceae bacterium]